jgi:hypothetical protein
MMRKPVGTFFLQYCITAVVALLMAAPAHAQRLGGGTFSRRSGQADNVHWTLSDWLLQKQEFRLEDQWLALNRQLNFFEFNIQGSQTRYDVSAGGSVKSHRVDRYSASIYFSIFGLEGGVENTDEDIDYKYGQFNVRIFGQSSRATNLTVGYGMRKREDRSQTPELDVTNQYANAKLQLYIFQYFGIDGSYRKDFTASDQANTKYEGERVEYGAFVEYQFVRLYGNAFVDNTYKTAPGATTQQETRSGIDAGVQFFL